MKRILLFLLLAPCALAQIVNGGGGGGTPCTSVALSLQFNSSGSFGCVAGSSVDATSGVITENPTFNNGSTVYNGHTLNVTNTASDPSSLIDRWQVGGSSKMTLDLNGNLVLSGGLTAGTGSTNFSTSTHTLPNKVGARSSAPSTCTQGETYSSTTLTVNGNLQLMCYSSNIWVNLDPGRLGKYWPGNAAISTAGMLFTQPGATPSNNAPTATAGETVSVATIATINSPQALSLSNLELRTGRNIWYYGQIRDTSVADIRLWLGFTDQSAATMGGSDGANTWNVVAFWYCNDAAAGCSVDETNYQCVVENAPGSGSVSVTDTGVAADTSDHEFMIVEDTINSKWHFLIDGVEKCGSGISANIPASGTNMRWIASLTNMVASSKTIVLSEGRIGIDK